MIAAVVRPLAAVPFTTDFGEEEHAAQQANIDPESLSFQRAAQEAVDRVASWKGWVAAWTPSFASVRQRIRSYTPPTSSKRTS